MASFTEPSIVKKGYRGDSLLRITDEMFERREIFCAGEIDTDQVNSLVCQLLYLSHDDPEQPITMYINSPGGSVSDGLALIDTMNCISAPITTICVGLAASMGALIFVSGTEGQRKMLPSSRILIHDPSRMNAGGSALQLKALSDDLMETRKILCQILADRTGKTLRQIYQVTQKDTYFSADNAIRFHLADEIVRSL